MISCSMVTTQAKQNQPQLESQGVCEKWFGHLHLYLFEVPKTNYHGSTSPFGYRFIVTYVPCLKLEQYIGYLLWNQWGGMVLHILQYYWTLMLGLSHDDYILYAKFHQYAPTQDFSSVCNSFSHLSKLC